MLSSYRSIFFLHLLCWLAISSCAQKQSENSNISPDLLQQDFKIFEDTLKKLHPGLYRYRTEVELNKVFDSCRTELNNSMPVEKFYLMLRWVIANVQDGHTSCSLPEQVRQRLITGGIMFPIQPVFLGQRAYLACQLKNTDLVPGTEILSIDGKSVNEIRQELFRYLASDGTNVTKKYWDLNHGAFSPFYYMVYGEKKSFSIKYRVQNKNGTTVISADSLTKLQCPRTSQYSGPSLQLKFVKDTIAVLTIKTFTSEGLNRREEYFEFLDSSFTEILRNKVQHLIIDVRDNGGGHDVFGSALYSYLVNRPFDYYTSLRSTTRIFQKSEHPNLEVQMPARKNYQNKVYILINGQSFSTTAEFCSIAKSHERAIFIGEETGGGYVGNTSGGNARVVLPNTQITVSIPKTRYTMAVKSPGANSGGIVPDHLVIPQIDDIIHQRDVQMHFAFRLIGVRGKEYRD